MYGGGLRARDVTFLKIDERNYIFDGKTPLIDFYKILNIDGKIFEKAKGESDTLAGFCIEQAGKILLKNERISYQNYHFTVEASDLVFEKAWFSQACGYLPERTTFF